MSDSYSERFAAFHAAHPEVYKELVRLARIARARGHQTVGIRMLWEVARWNLLVDSAKSRSFKLNDHFTSRYARLIMKNEPELEGIFRVRALRTD